MTDGPDVELGIDDAPPSPREYLELYDFRLRVFEMYRERNKGLAQGQDAELLWEDFRSRRDHLFKDHPQSALGSGQKQLFTTLDYFPYDRTMCVPAVLDPDVEPQLLQVETSGTETMSMRRAGLARFELAGHSMRLSVYWIDVYGGGLFLPFRDATCPRESYGGGRYLFDTVKGSDSFALSAWEGGQRLLFDFNYAYNPSCAYDHRWSCPLAPGENRLDVRIPAGERRFEVES